MNHSVQDQSSSSNDLVRINPNGSPFVTLQEYEANQAMINAAKANLEALQARNEEGLRNYAMTELQKTIEKGRAAAVVMENMQAKAISQSHVLTSTNYTNAAASPSVNRLNSQGPVQRHRVPPEAGVQGHGSGMERKITPDARTYATPRTQVNGNLQHVSGGHTHALTSDNTSQPFSSGGHQGYQSQHTNGSQQSHSIPSSTYHSSAYTNTRSQEVRQQPSRPSSGQTTRPIPQLYRNQSSRESNQQPTPSQYWENLAHVYPPPAMQNLTGTGTPVKQPSVRPMNMNEVPAQNKTTAGNIFRSTSSLSGALGEPPTTISIGQEVHPSRTPTSTTVPTSSSATHHNLANPAPRTERSQSASTPLPQTISRNAPQSQFADDKQSGTLFQTEVQPSQRLPGDGTTLPSPAMSLPSSSATKTAKSTISNTSTGAHMATPNAFASRVSASAAQQTAASSTAAAASSIPSTGSAGPSIARWRTQNGASHTSTPVQVAQPPLSSSVPEPTPVGTFSHRPPISQYVSGVSTKFKAFDPYASHAPASGVFRPYGSELTMNAIPNQVTPTAFVGHQGEPGHTNLTAQYQYKPYNGPTNPVYQYVPAQPVTPASADRRRLAKDILRALGPPSNKRKSPEPIEEPPTKKQILEPESSNIIDVDEIEEMHQDINRKDVAAFLKDIDDIPATPVDVSPTASRDHSPAVEIPLNVLEGLNGTLVQEIKEGGEVSNKADAQTESNTKESSALDMSSHLQATSKSGDANNSLSSSKVPLFLPSPSTSVHGGVTDVGVDEFAGLSTNPAVSSGPRRRMQVYVLAPPLPDWAKPIKGTKVAGKQTQAPIAIHDEGDTEGRRQLAEAVQSSARIASSHLRQRPCLWKECFHTLNNGDKLKSHVAEHVDLEEKMPLGASHICFWDKCTRRFKTPGVLLHHLQNHVRKTIFCPYQGCDDVFQAPSELFKHQDMKHKNDKLRSTTDPYKPTRFIRLPPLHTLTPAFTVVDLPVYGERIMKDRRAKLGPWVLRNIFGPVNLDIPKHNPRFPLRNSRRFGASDKSVDANNPLSGRHDEYDFLASYSSYPSACGDLEASKVSDLIDEGLVLWGREVVRAADSRNSAITLKAPPKEGFEVMDYLPNHGASIDGNGVTDAAITVARDLKTETGAVGGLEFGFEIPGGGDEEAVEDLL